MNSQKKDFLNLIEKHFNIIRKICNVYCYSGYDREDLAQEIVYQLWKSFKNFENRSAFSTWMYRVALNTAIGFTRLKQAKHYSLEEIPPLFSEDSGKSEIDILAAELYSAIARLNSIDKAVIMLWLERKTYSEISEVTGLKEKNVSVKLVRIKSKLKDSLKDIEIDIKTD